MKISNEIVLFNKNYYTKTIELFFTSVLLFFYNTTYVHSLGF